MIKKSKHLYLELIIVCLHGNRNWKRFILIDQEARDLYSVEKKIENSKSFKKSTQFQFKSHSVKLTFFKQNYLSLTKRSWVPWFLFLTNSIMCCENSTWKNISQWRENYSVKTIHHQAMVRFFSLKNIEIIFW